MCGIVLYPGNPEETLHCRNVGVIKYSVSHIAKAEALIEIIQRITL